MKVTQKQTRREREELNTQQSNRYYLILIYNCLLITCNEIDMLISGSVFVCESSSVWHWDESVSLSLSIFVCVAYLFRSKYLNWCYENKNLCLVSIEQARGIKDRLKYPPEKPKKQENKYGIIYQLNIQLESNLSFLKQHKYNARMNLCRYNSFRLIIRIDFSAFFPFFLDFDSLSLLLSSFFFLLIVENRSIFLSFTRPALFKCILFKEFFAQAKKKENRKRISKYILFIIRSSFAGTQKKK